MCICLEVFPTWRDHPNSRRQQAPLPVPVHVLVQSSSPCQQISLQRARQTCKHSPQPCQPMALSVTTPFLLLSLFPLELKLLCIPPPLPVPWTVLLPAADNVPACVPHRVMLFCHKTSSLLPSLAAPAKKAAALPGTHQPSQLQESHNSLIICRP